jgi:AcrR family transcriptional regulator
MSDMSRATAPLLTRRSIVDTALRMIDRDGYTAFSMPRLGDELGVRTPSLYHHFRDRADVMAEIARTVVLRTPRPTLPPGAPWQDYFVELALNFRRTILAHRNCAPVLLQYLPRDVLVRLYEAAALELAEHEATVPRFLHVLFLDGLERLTIGSALIEAIDPRSHSQSPFPMISPEEHPNLSAAVAANTLDPEQLFVATVRAFLVGVAKDGAIPTVD